MVPMNHRRQRLALVRAIDCLPQDIPGASSLIVDNAVSLDSERQFLTAQSGIKDADRADILCLGNNAGSQRTCCSSFQEHNQISLALAIVYHAHL